MEKHLSIEITLKQYEKWIKEYNEKTFRWIVELKNNGYATEALKVVIKYLFESARQNL